MLDALYVDSKDTRSIVAIKPKAPFCPISQEDITTAGSGVALIQEPPYDDPEAQGDPCFWWRQGGAEAHRT